MNSWLTRLFRPNIELDPETVRRLKTWSDAAPVDGRTPLADLRSVIVDVETTGLDARRDRLLAIGMVPLNDNRLCVGAAQEILLRRDEASPRGNILVHGISPQEQAAGDPPEQALLAFLECIGHSPLVAFHASFDQAVLGRALRGVLGVRLRSRFIDLAHLAPRLVPEAGIRRASLDDWLDYFQLRVQVRHRAVYDAVVTGELFLILLSRAAVQGISTLAALCAAAEPPAGISNGGMRGA